MSVDCGVVPSSRTAYGCNLAGSTSKDDFCVAEPVRGDSSEMKTVFAGRVGSNMCRPVHIKLSAFYAFQRRIKNSRTSFAPV
jgi:hypothetical protein